MTESSDAIAALRRQGVQVDCPAGTVRTTVNVLADSGWLLFGQTVANAQSIYPALWSVVPASWQSGTSLVLPSMTDRFAVGGGTTVVGAVGGANSKTIGSNNLPAHTHTITDPTHNHTQNAHSHAAASGTFFLESNNTLGIASGAAKFDLSTIHGSTATATATNIAAATGITATDANVTTATALDVTPACLALVYQIRAF